MKILNWNWILSVNTWGHFFSLLKNKFEDYTLHMSNTSEYWVSSSLCINSWMEYKNVARWIFQYRNISWHRILEWINRSWNFMDKVHLFVLFRFRYSHRVFHTENYQIFAIAGDSYNNRYVLKIWNAHFLSYRWKTHPRKRCQCFSIQLSLHLRLFQMIRSHERVEYLENSCVKIFWRDEYFLKYERALSVFHSVRIFL